MRILIVHTLYKIKGGEDSVVDNEANLLKAAGHEVELLLFSNNAHTAAKLLQMPFNISSYHQTIRSIKAFKPDVMHVHNLHFAGSPSVLYAARRLHVPVVMTLHNYRLLCPSGTLFFNDELFTDSVQHLFPAEAIKRGVYQRSKLITLLVGLSGMVHQMIGTWDIPQRYVVLGDNAKNIFEGSKLKHLTSRMSIKPNFCFPSSLRKQRNDGYFLYVGRLSSEKGIATLLNAFERTKQQLKIVGAGPMEAEVKAATGRTASIEFLGSRSGLEVRELIAGAEALVFPSVWHETFGMVIIEAFSCGTPVIASSMGEPKHIITDKVTGLLFNSGDENDLIARISEFEHMTDNEKSVMSENALRAYTENYTPDGNLNQLCRIYSLVIKKAA
jgi:glycosyltransferase involved in cell wall biosynthesis